MKEDGLYKDRKYVKMAGHTAYAGVLVALDALLGKKGKGRKDVDWYKQNLAKLDKKLVGTFSTVYQVLHIDMSYDGADSAELVFFGLDKADTIINWVATRTAAA